MSDLENEKARAAYRAVDEVGDGMLLGLGTGSTAAYAIRELGKRVSQGLRIEATATSVASENLARSVGIELRPFNSIGRVDLTIDGADEVDPDLRAIKGGGGALLREKVVAAASDRVTIIVDSSKPVTCLGKFKLPVEVLPFAISYVQQTLTTNKISMTQRLNRDGTPFLTDQGAYILDLSLGLIKDPVQLARWLDGIPGVIEHGLFLTEIDALFIGRGNDVEIINREQ